MPPKANARFQRAHLIEQALEGCGPEVISDVRDALRLLAAYPRGCDEQPVDRYRFDDYPGRSLAQLPHGFTMTFRYREAVPPLMVNVIHVDAFLRRLDVG